MRRSLSIVVLLLLSLPLLAPLFASTPDDALPACCRRNGAHHCMGMAIAEAASQHPFFHTTCPSYHRADAALSSHHSLTREIQTRFASITTHPAGHPQAEARCRLASLRSRHKRGPPTLLV